MWNWIRVSSLLLVMAACEFPRPADVETGSCQRDEDCGGSTPYCAGGTCGACAASITCPAARPVCDEVSHDCRTCVKDSECDSMACDIAAGTCVEQAAILYASPAGGEADSCTRTNPCSLSKAVSSIDAAHEYLVLLPGVHTGRADFEGKQATVCGNNATVDVRAGRVWLSSNSTVTIRDLNFVFTSGFDYDSNYVIRYDNSDLTLDNVHIKIDLPQPARGIIGTSSQAENPAKLTIRNSSFEHAALQLEGHFVIDRTKIIFGSGITVYGSSFGTGETIANSLLVFPLGTGEILIGAEAQRNTSFSNNTIVGGAINCGDAISREYFARNVIYNTNISQTTGACNFGLNLIMPMASLGESNIFGDPMFVDEANNDFHLRPGSPAIDAADPSIPSETGYDLGGTLRPQGARFDLGAYEYVP